jgi:NTP pyrophosphatase (non-canonical NTP hydrolase)
MSFAAIITNMPNIPLPTITHPQLVAALLKRGSEILPTLTPEDVDILNCSACIMGEAGELFDAIKKKVFYRQELDRANVVEELGDLEFYLEGLRRSIGISREETLVGNIYKLGDRYKKLTYSDEAAQARADKVNKMHPVEVCKNCLQPVSGIITSHYDYKDNRYSCERARNHPDDTAKAFEDLRTGFEWDKAEPSRVITNWNGFERPINGVALVMTDLMTKAQFEERAVFCTQVPIGSKEGYEAARVGNQLSPTEFDGDRRGSWSEEDVH